MPPVIDTRLPATASVTDISAIIAAQTKNASGAAAPIPCATSAGSTKIPAPTVVLTMAAVS